MFLLDVRVPFCLLGGVPRYCSLLRGVYAVCDCLCSLALLVPHRNSGVFGWQCLLSGGYVFICVVGRCVAIVGACI
jgi:hypothetical protein